MYIFNIIKIDKIQKLVLFWVINKTNYWALIKTKYFSLMVKLYLTKSNYTILQILFKKYGVLSKNETKQISKEW